MKAEPNQWAGCYTLHLYCENLSAHPYKNKFGEFFGETFSEARRNALKRGWIMNGMTRTAICPNCKNAGYKFKEP